MKPQRDEDWFTIASAMVSPDPRQGAVALQMNPQEARNYRVISNLGAAGRWHCSGRYTDLSPALARYTSLCQQGRLQDYYYIDQRQRHIPRFLVPIEGSFLTAELPSASIQRRTARSAARALPAPRRAGLLKRVWSHLAPRHPSKSSA